ncbi:MAG: gluconate 2-dehydrogenase subunit 3 family protein [Gammaproteobacteria bacterium]|nr:gluconate 2-dehydrogenase subunit 3 family protein [Gammaproteobacteria bacterium]
MYKSLQSRRQFLKSSSSAVGITLAGINLPALLSIGTAAAQARDQAEALHTLGAQEAADLEAIAAQIIPTDETPGAREAGVIYFIDGAMAGMFAHALPELRDGLAALNRKVPGDDQGFANLGSDEQVALLRREESSGFFGLVRFLTLAGMFSLPEYGGNRDHIGWKMIGFDHRHAWSAPFGYYDAHYAEGGSDHEAS